MMKLFRRARHFLFYKGKLKKYFLYAIGEILLVMIGILLALQINTWNDKRKERNAEIVYYENIKDQITNDKDQIEKQLDYNTRHLLQFNYAIEIIENNDRTKSDTLGKIARNLTNYSDFDRQGNIYETMVNSGQIKLLNNHMIVESIRELEERYFYINRMESIHYDAMITYVVPILIPAVKFSTGEVKTLNVIYSFEFHNLILSLLKIMKEKDQIYHLAINEIGDIITMINQELNAERD